MTPVALSAVTGLLLVSLFPSFSYTYLAPVAMVPLLVAMGREPRPGKRFLYGWLGGALFWGGTCYWIYGVLHVHGHVPAPGAASLFIGFSLAKGLHLGAFAWLAGPLLKRAWAIPAVAAAWTAVEGTHPYAGFTWLMLGNAATDVPALARLAPLTGIGGVSFVLAMLNAAVALALLGRPRKHLGWVLAAPLLYLLPPLPDAAAGRHAVRLVQPNIDEEEIYGSAWTPERARGILGQFSALSLAAGSDPELIVWPENPAPLYFYNDRLFRAYTEDIARREKAHLLFGTVAFRGEREPLNSAVLLGPEGNEIARYDKIYLVPFGEFVPPPFGSLVEKVTREAGDFVAGDRVVVAQAGGHRIGTFICYESAFGRGVRRFVQGGAELLVNISNDGWFGRSAAREQHLLIARMRAIENRRWLLRGTNTGVTAAIDPAGRVRGRLPVDRPGALDSHFDYVSGTTFYSRWGEWFWILTCLAVLAVKGIVR